MASTGRPCSKASGISVSASDASTAPSAKLSATASTESLNPPATTGRNNGEREQDGT
jgi:hypothetical protein